MIVASASEASTIDHHGAEPGTAKVAMRLGGLHKTYPGAAQPAVRDLSLDVRDGEIVTLVDGQGVILIYGERHNPLAEGGKVWLKLRPDGHTAWASDWSAKAVND
jgi:hypothetical protein